MMAGKCKLVAASVGLGTGISPNGVKASTMDSAPNTPATARSWVLSRRPLNTERRSCSTGASLCDVLWVNDGPGISRAARAKQKKNDGVGTPSAENQFFLPSRSPERSQRHRIKSRLAGY